ncbi:hypothetical protein [Paracoccus sulfuroxidans]|uniref:Uncharacterized protein n=1 Tax=Paracoccus sulfuroxidans TaxID=384678 RepID=A0A562NKK7_9RHOB|nr:hypothetical protein [Paracoccus sulfuroxidans]TWI32739.1 hypothetical protein IQ24_02614 [Paracoccus sulfuroxidans]
MRDGDEADAIDTDLEISARELEIDDAKRDQKWTVWLGTASILLLSVFYQLALSRPEAVTCGAAIFLLVGIKDHLYRMRISQARDQIVALRLWDTAEMARGKHTMRIVRALEPPSQTPPQR